MSIKEQLCVFKAPYKINIYKFTSRQSILVKEQLLSDVAGRITNTEKDVNFRMKK
jgi:hypothetical protein